MYFTKSGIEKPLKSYYERPKHQCYVCLEEDYETKRVCDCSYYAHINCAKNLEYCGCCRRKYYWGCWGIAKKTVNKQTLSENMMLLRLLDDDIMLSLFRSRSTDFFR
jgi:hypothetical protein